MTTNDYISSATTNRPRALVALWAAIAALLATAVFGVFSVADTPSASEPEVAVRQLLAAANKSDVLGALGALLPSERDLLRQPFTDLMGEAQRLGLASDKIDLNHVDGVTLKFDDIKTSVKTLTPDFAAVTLTGGKVTSLFDARRLAGPLLAEVGVDASQAVSDSQTEDIKSAPVELMTVRESGRWYVSIAYSIAEAMRKDGGGALPDFGNELEARGEASPEQAVDTAVRAALAGDLEHLVALIGSAEGRALRDYAPLFLPATKGSGLNANIRKLTLGVSDRSGSSAKVAIKTFDIELSLDGSPARFAFDGKCSTITFPGERPQRTCNADALKALPFLNALPGATSTLADLNIAVVNENGKWFISPTKTVTDLFLTVTHALDRTTLRKTIDSIREQVTGAPARA
jgi:hypothetical protein